jgi:hypothetical protein
MIKKTTKEDIALALKISKIIQARIDITGDTNLRSTDVFPFLVKKGLFVPDKHNGYHFRKFLNKLAKTGELKSLIPQCTQIKPLNDHIFSEWYFHNAKDKMPKSVDITNDQDTSLNKDRLDSDFSKNMDLEEAIEIIKMMINNINPISQKPFDDLGVCLDMTVKEALKTLIDLRVNTHKAKPKKINATPDRPIKKYINRIENKIKLDETSVSTYYSATALGKLKGKTYDEVLKIMKSHDYIIDRYQITYKGLNKGLKIKQNSEGKKWIVYPELLASIL